MMFWQEKPTLSAMPDSQTSKRKPHHKQTITYPIARSPWKNLHQHRYEREIHFGKINRNKYAFQEMWVLCGGKTLSGWIGECSSQTKHITGIRIMKKLLILLEFYHLVLIHRLHSDFGIFPPCVLYPAEEFPINGWKGLPERYFITIEGIILHRKRYSHT